MIPVRLSAFVLSHTARIAFGALLFGVVSISFAAPSASADSMRLAAEYLLKSQQQSWFLSYGFDFLEDTAVEPEGMSAVQLVRQALTAAFLVDYSVLAQEERALPVIRRLIDAFERHSLPISKRPLQGVIERTGVLSTPVGRWKLESALRRYGLLFEQSGAGKVLSPDSNYDNAYTGATALALLTEVRYWRATGDDRYAALRHAWLEGLIALHVPDEGFRQIPGSIDSHPYFDGESWLALAEYHRVFPEDRRVGKLLEDVDAAMMRRYSRVNIKFFHWGVMTAAVRFADTHEQTYLKFVKDQLKQLLERPGLRPRNIIYCAGVEGVVDAMVVLREAGEGGSVLFADAMEWTRREMVWAWEAQIQPGQTELDFGQARILAPRMREFAGGFRSERFRADVSMDTTGHCLAAMVKLKRAGIELRPAV